jgi:hypothetical protein
VQLRWREQFARGKPSRVAREWAKARGLFDGERLTDYGRHWIEKSVWRDVFRSVEVRL